MSRVDSLARTRYSPACAHTTAQYAFCPREYIVNNCYNFPEYNYLFEISNLAIRMPESASLRPAISNWALDHLLSIPRIGLPSNLCSFQWLESSHSEYFAGINYPEFWRGFSGFRFWPIALESGRLGVLSIIGNFVSWIKILDISGYFWLFQMDYSFFLMWSSHSEFLIRSNEEEIVNLHFLENRTLTSDRKHFEKLFDL